MYIEPQDLNPENGVIIDIRSKAEHDNMHITMEHQLAPLDEITLREFAAALPDQPLYILCHSGGRAMMFANLLNQCRIDSVYVVEGGITACSACMNIEGSQTMSEEIIHGHAGESVQGFMARNDIG